MSGDDDDPPDLLATVPLGGLLGALLRLLVAADRRDEFLGDLIEEANLRSPFCSRGDLTLWLWGQALSSVPALIGWRIRRLAVVPPASLVVAGRGGRRGLTLPVAVSVSAHALLLTAVLSVVLSRVDDIQLPIDATAILTDPPADEAVAEKAIASGLAGATAFDLRSRRLRIARRPPAQAHPVAAADPRGLPAGDPRGSMLATVARGGLPGVIDPSAAVTALPPASGGTNGGLSAANTTTTGSVAGGPIASGLALPGAYGARRPPGAEARLRLPPRVGEKRCVSCPTPQLPHPYARLGIGQEMLVKTCVGIKGDVTSAEVLHGFDPVVDAEVIATVRRWQLSPYSLDGHPVPFCYTTRFLFTTH